MQVSSYVSDDIPSKPVRGWAKITVSGDRSNPEKKLIWGYVDAAHSLAIKLEDYKERFSTDNICTDVGCELVPAMFRLCKKAASLALNHFYENHSLSGKVYTGYSNGWNDVKTHLHLDDYSALDELVEVFDTVNENDLIRSGKTMYVNYETLCGETRRFVALVTSRAE